MLAEEIRPLDYYKSLSLDELKAEIEREETLLAGFRDQLAEAIRQKDRIQSIIDKEGLLTAEERVKEREKSIRKLQYAIIDLQVDIEERNREVWNLLQRIDILERRLPILSSVNRFITRRVISSLEDSIRALRGWQTRRRNEIASLEGSITALKGWQTREKEAVERLEQLQTELTYWDKQTLTLKEQTSIIEGELDKKDEALPRYKLVEYTKYFEVIVRRPSQTPPIRFEVRGEFTIPADLENDDPKVISVVEKKLTEAFENWGKPQFRKTVVSNIAYALAMGRGESPAKYSKRAEGGYWKLSGPYGGINLSDYTETAATYGEEEVGITDRFIETVTVIIVKYINMNQVGGPWKETVIVKEEEYM